jgi:hypothetical protein
VPAEVGIRPSNQADQGRICAFTAEHWVTNPLAVPNGMPLRDELELELLLVP